jgi:redox-sensitive bicupin YhaK (pirin superfamily)
VSRYVLQGEAAFGGNEKQHRSDAFHTLILSDDGGVLEVHALEGEEEEPCSFVLFAAEPIREEVVQAGPFVLSTNRQVHA